VLRDFDPVTLRLFVAVCEERNIAGAAERETIVASAVSKRIAAIEREIGVPLLVRGRRGIRPTAAGEAFLRQAREVLGTLGRMRAQMLEFAAGVRGSIRVVASVSALSDRLPEAIAAFLAAHQAVRVTLDEMTSTEIVRTVRDGAADIGVLWDLADTSGLQVVPYREDHLCAVVHRSHPLAGRKRLRFEETLTHAVVRVAPGGLMDALLRRQAALGGKVPVSRIQVSSLEAACRIVGAGLGLAVMPREAAEPHASTCNLRVIPLSDPWAKRRFVICSRDHSTLTTATRLLRDYLGSHARHARDVGQPSARRRSSD